MRFSKADAAVALGVVLLSSAMVFLFARDMGDATPKKDSVVAGTIVFRKNAATRRGSDSLRWENLRNNSALYGGDTIRTSGGSEAALHFADGASLDVFENSMLRIESGSSGSSIDFASGALRVSGSGPAPRTVRSGDSTITISADADVSMIKSKDALELDVSSGQATVSGRVGAPRTLTDRQVMRIDAKTGETSIREKKIDPFMPAQGARTVSCDGSRRIEFRARVIVPVDGPAFEIATDPGFTKNVRRLEAVVGDGEIAASAELEPATWFWRVSYSDAEGSAESGKSESVAVSRPPLGFSSVRRFSFFVSPMPILSFPRDGDEIAYRKTSPTIRFSWGESAGASGYTLELSRSDGNAVPERRYRTGLTSLSVSSVSDGPWYWRVVPEYSATRIGEMPELPFRRFTVVKSSEMEKPIALAPLDGNLYALKDMAIRGMLFSWRPVPDASKYELRLYDSADSKDPLAVLVSREPWIRIDAKNLPRLAREGTLFWSVAWRDSDGAVSAESDRRSVTGADERFALRLTLPPEGYLIASAAIDTVRFSWKSNVRARTVFLLSADPEFSRVAFQKECEGDSILGVPAGEGDWYWKIRTYNVDGSIFMETEPRRMSVVNALAAPNFLKPETIPEVTLLDGSPLEIAWGAVSGADYYSVSVFPVGSPSSPILHLPRVTDTSIELPSMGMRTGKYGISVQPFAEAGARSTRVVGKIARVDADVRFLSRVERRYPKDGAIIDGISAWKDGVRVEWKWRDKPETLKLSLAKDGTKYPVKFSWSGSASSFVIPRLAPGKYVWRIEASSGGYDLSPKTSGYFTVRGIPPLPAPVAVSPKDGASLGSAYFSGASSIVFSWEPVSQATSYRFRIVSLRDGRAVASADGLREPRFVLTDLRCLDRGDFAWEVSARDTSDSAPGGREGKTARFRLSIALPALTVPHGKEIGDFYGL